MMPIIPQGANKIVHDKDKPQVAQPASTMFGGYQQQPSEFLMDRKKTVYQNEHKIDDFSSEEDGGGFLADKKA